MDQKLYVQIENKSLIPFFEPARDSFRELTLTTIQDYQRTAIVTIYTRDAAGRNVQLKQYTVKSIPKAKAGEPKIGLNTRTRGYRKIDIELSLNGKPVITDRIKLPGTGRRLLVILLILLFVLLLAGGGYYLLTLLQHGSGQADSIGASRTTAPRTPAVTREPPALDRASTPAPAPEASTEKPETSPAESSVETAVEELPREDRAAQPAVPPEPLQRVFYFTPDSAVLTGETEAALDRLIPELRRYSDAPIEISGHCAPHGTEQGRQELSELRAERVAQYLRRSGIEIAQNRVQGLGAQAPVTMDSEEQHLNRRVEIIIGTRED
ncbi:OmpA family protein [Marispirochaeta sp.]|uniref:OmpA family protein n=1 Tax=Marispirochaeta sp. TaxID=2038653 RepID=UPI0029C7F1FA|nr:OmpA family protein [Marispirochaeta sp.]